MTTEVRECPGYELFQGNPRQIPDVDPVQIRLSVLNNQVQGVDCQFYLPSGLCDRPRVEALHKISGRSGTLTRCGAATDRNQLRLVSASEVSEPDSIPIALIPTPSTVLDGEVLDAENAFERPLRMVVGVTYLPFAEAKEFARVDWDSHFDDESDEYSFPLEKKLELGGIKGCFALNPFKSDDESDEDPYFDADKPLGSIRVVKIYGNDEDEDGLEYPLSFYLNFEAKNIEDFDYLHDLTLQIKCGGRTYYLNCYGSEDIASDVDESSFDELEEDEPLVLIDENLIGANGRDTSSLLPWDLEKIKEIEIRVLTNDEYNETTKV